jgi:carbon storage regulator CsrA
MLALTRKKGEVIRIGDDIFIKYLGLNNWGNPKFAISAPDSISVVRKELTEEDELITESVDNPVIKYKKSLSRLDCKPR